MTRITIVRGAGSRRILPPTQRVLTLLISLSFATSLFADTFAAAGDGVQLWYTERGEGSRVRDLEALRQHLGLGKVTLLAHSFGPAIAALYAIRYPEHVDRMIFLGPIPPSRSTASACATASRKPVPNARRPSPSTPTTCRPSAASTGRS